MVTFEQVYAFCKQHYKHERFEYRNDDYCPNYSQLVAESTYEALRKYGYSLFSHHEMRSGEVLFFDDNLNLLTQEEWKERIRRASNTNF